MENAAEVRALQSLDRVQVIIPAQDEERSIPLVLGDLPAVGRVIVVNNDSSDNTVHVAKSAGADVVDEPRRGYGSACLRGLQAVREAIDEGATAPAVIVFLDADYSDHPEYLTHLVEPLFVGDADMVLGSRLMGEREPGAMPPQAVFGNKLACFLIHLFWRHRFTDLGPFRAIRYDALSKLNMQDENFGWTVEMQVKAIRHKLQIVEIPVPYRCRIGASKISGTISGSIRAGYKILLTIARYAVQR